MKDIYKFNTKGKSKEESIVQGEKFRFTILTPQMVRMEYSEDGIFEDRATQVVVNRDFEIPKFSVVDEENSLEIFTEYLHITYDKKMFSKNGLIVQIKSKNAAHWNNTWHFSEETRDLKGTTRTLDGVNGETSLGPGMMSRTGYTLIDDSKSFVLTEDGWIEPRKKGVYDVYFLGYPKEYKKCIRDFYKLCGGTPLLPRFALGNWWSRYYPYSDEGYRELMDRFQEEKVPFSVAVIDMDWHITEVDPKYGGGWTGYTWNRKLFPDPKVFMDNLHDRDLKITLNVHPADGVRGFEDAYLDMAKELGVDYENEQPIQFDIADPKFLEAYFKHLHHPHEKNGVDFWWIDWQQGSSTKAEGLDPLWMLNHYHFLDSGREGKRPLTFSRYAGVGSHRYPVGFSGDTVISWESLDFQPYFTATASNVGYGWWSHDIGGHMGGTKDDELMVRWVQLGVFSPIMRLHSTMNIFNGKEPWRYNDIAHKIINNFLRLRHQLLPYLYTMNARCHEEGEQLVQPMYYEHPQKAEAYEMKNQYYFGSELIVCPITSPGDSRLDRGKVKAWLPKGTFIDIFNGLIYRGNRTLNLYRSQEEMPVLAKAGAILPLSSIEESMKNGTGIPKDMVIKIFAGADGQLSLYEDDGATMEYERGKSVYTGMTFLWDEDSESSFNISAVKDEYGILPEERNYVLQFTGVKDTDDICVTSKGKAVLSFSKHYDKKMNMLEVTVNNIPVSAGLKVSFPSKLTMAENAVEERIFDFLNSAQIRFETKQRIYDVVRENHGSAGVLGDLQSMELPEDLYGVLTEIILA